MMGNDWKWFGDCVCLLAGLLACLLACAPVCARLHACMLACLRAHMLACLLTPALACLLACLFACLLACLPACLPSCLLWYRSHLFQSPCLSTIPSLFHIDLFRVVYLRQPLGFIGYLAGICIAHQCVVLLFDWTSVLACWEFPCILPSTLVSYWDACSCRMHSCIGVGICSANARLVGDQIVIVCYVSPSYFNRTLFAITNASNLRIILWKIK